MVVTLVYKMYIKKDSTKGEEKNKISQIEA